MITEEVGIQDGIATQHVRNVEVEWSDWYIRISCGIISAANNDLLVLWKFVVCNKIFCFLVALKVNDNYTCGAMKLQCCGIEVKVMWGVLVTDRVQCTMSFFFLRVVWSSFIYKKDAPEASWNVATQRVDKVTKIFQHVGCCVCVHMHVPGQQLTEDVTELLLHPVYSSSITYTQFLHHSATDWLPLEDSSGGPCGCKYCIIYMHVCFHKYSERLN
jgi:hypothetical protein